MILSWPPLYYQAQGSLIIILVLVSVVCHRDTLDGAEQSLEHIVLSTETSGGRCYLNLGRYSMRSKAETHNLLVSVRGRSSPTLAPLHFFIALALVGIFPLLLPTVPSPAPHCAISPSTTDNLDYAYKHKEMFYLLLSSTARLRGASPCRAPWLSFEGLALELLTLPVSLWKILALLVIFLKVKAGGLWIKQCRLTVCTLTTARAVPLFSGMGKRVQQ